MVRITFKTWKNGAFTTFDSIAATEREARDQAERFAKAPGNNWSLEVCLVQPYVPPTLCNFVTKLPDGTVREGCCKG